MNCSICFDTNSKCDVCCNVYCNDCFIDYISFCTRESSIPRCHTCSSELLYSKLYPNLDNVLLEKICDIISKKIFKSHQESIEESIRIKKLWEQKVNEKLEFIGSNFPLAIKFIIEKVFPKNVKKIIRDNKSYIGKIRCPNEHCAFGILGESNKCLLCLKRYCPKCLVEINGLHKCNPQDLESIEFIKNLVKCPSCKFPVLKSFGCNAITCSICRTNFSYINGKVCCLGNHTEKEPRTELKTSTKNLSLILHESGLYNETIIQKVIDLELQIEKHLIKESSWISKLKRDIKNSVGSITICKFYEKIQKLQTDISDFGQDLLKFQYEFEEKNVVVL